MWFSAHPQPALTNAGGSGARLGVVSDTSRARRVLVVDDEGHITELVSMGLTYNGSDVERAGSGRPPLHALDRSRPDLVLLDVMLPGLDGFEVAPRLRQAGGAGTRVPI